MNLLSTFFAFALSSSTPADNSCAAYLLTDPGCEQDLHLSAYQARQVALLRSQTRRRAASLNLELRRIDAALQNARGFARSRLLQRRSALISQMNRQRAVATSRVNAMLSLQQRNRCHWFASGRIHARRPVAPRRRVRVTVNRPMPPRYQAKQPPKHRDDTKYRNNTRYRNNAKQVRRAAPPSGKASGNYNRVTRTTSKGNHRTPGNRGKPAPAPQKKNQRHGRSK